MSDYKGDFAANSTVRITFNTFDSNGASVTITQLATTDVFVYKDGTVLGDPDAGVTLDLNEGAVNGSHRVSVDLSSDVQYATGADYEVQFKGADIDGNEVNIFVGEFSIENRFMRGTDGVDTSTMVGTDDAALASVLGAAVGASISADIAAIPTTMVGTDDAALASVLGSAVGASISADIAAIPTTMVGTDDAALASVLGSAVGATISADIAAIPTTMVGTDNAATETKQDAGDVVRDRIAAIQEADRIIDFPNGTLTYNTKGTSNALLTKDLKDPDDAAVDSTEDVIAAEENV
jgi:hypothetical protein